jgi:hypothetical protein
LSIAIAAVSVATKADPHVAAMIEALVAEAVAPLVARIDALETRQARTLRTPRHGAFLAGVARCIGAAVFDSDEIFRVAEHNDALQAHLKEHGIATTTMLGARLRTIQKLGNVDGFAVTKCGRGNRGQRWAIELAPFTGS